MRKKKYKYKDDQFEFTFISEGRIGSYDNCLDMMFKGQELYGDRFSNVSYKDYKTKIMKCIAREIG